MSLPQTSEPTTLELNGFNTLFLERIYPDQLANFWDPFVKTAVRAGLPEPLRDDSEQQQTIFVLLKMDYMKVYTLVGKKESGERIVLATVILTVQVNPYTHNNNMLIWSLVNLEHIELSIWVEAFGLLRRLAIEHNCCLIHAYTDNPRVEEMAKAIAGDRVWSFKLLEFKV